MCVISFVSQHAFVNIKGGGVLSSLSVAYLTLSYPVLRSSLSSFQFLCFAISWPFSFHLPVVFFFLAKVAYFFVSSCSSPQIFGGLLVSCPNFANQLFSRTPPRLRLQLHTLICQKLPDLSLFALLSLFFVCALCSAVLLPGEKAAR